MENGRRGRGGGGRGADESILMTTGDPFCVNGAYIREFSNTFTGTSRRCHGRVGQSVSMVVGFWKHWETQRNGFHGEPNVGSKGMR